MRHFFLIQTAAIVGIPAALLAQTPNIPKVIPAEPSKKAEAAEKAAANAKAAEKAAKASEVAKSAEKASSSQQSAEKAKAAQEAASKAESAQKASSKAEAAQKAAEKAQSAQKAAEKAVTAQRAAEKAQSAQKAAEKATIAQKAAEKAVSAQRAADKAVAAQKAAEKATAAQKVAEKAATSQKAADKAEQASKAASKAESAQKVAEKASIADRTATKADAAERAVRSAENAGKTAEKSSDSQKTADRIQQTTQAAEKAQTATAVQSKVPPNRTIPAPKAPEDKSRTTQKSAPTPPPTNTVAKAADKSPSQKPPNSIRKAAGGDGNKQDSNISQNVQTRSAANAERKLLVTELAKDTLTGIGVSEEASQKLAERFSDGDQDAQKTINVAADSAAALQYVGADSSKIEAVVTEIADRRLTDRSKGGAADNLVGQVIIEELTGRKAPKNSLQGEVARSLLNAKAALQTIAVDEDSEVGAALINKIVDEGLHGDRAKALIDATVKPIVDAAFAEQTQFVNDQATNTAGNGGPETVARPDPGLVEIKAPPAVEGPGGPAAEPAPENTGPAPVEGTAPVVTETVPETTAPAAEVPTTVTPGPGGDAPVNTGPVQAADTQTAPNPAREAPTNPATAGFGEGENTVEIRDEGDRLIFTEKDSSGNVVSTTIIIDMGDGRESVVVKDGEGNVTDAFVQNAPGETVVEGQRGSGDSSSNTNQNQQTENTNTESNQEGENSDSEAAATPTPPPDEESGEEEAPAEESATQDTAQNSTPNPMDDGGVNPAELAIRTEGRLGGEQARNQQKALDLKAGGGGAAGPREGNSAPVLLTREEQNNFRRLYQQKKGGGVTDPSPIEDSGIAVTIRDLKELHLRGNGGAKGPVENTAPSAPPADPHSPITGPAPVPAPGVNARVPVQIQKIDVDASVQQSIDANIRSK